MIATLERSPTTGCSSRPARGAYPGTGAEVLKNGVIEMTPEQREELVRLLQKGEELSPEWSRILFPPEKREYELVYHGKEWEEDILADTLAVPLQPVRNPYRRS